MQIDSIALSPRTLHLEDNDIRSLENVDITLTECEDDPICEDVDWCGDDPMCMNHDL